jgi:Peptidase A4 family
MPQVAGDPCRAAHRVTSAGRRCLGVARWTLPLAIVVAITCSACGSSPFPSNWAGYDVTGGRFTSVSASWVQPAVYTSGAGPAWASFWVGLDGTEDHFVEQIGTEGGTSGQDAYYSAWYEMFPARPVALDMAVRPGDLMHATVSRNGTASFTLTLINETTGKSFATTQSAAKPRGLSAEVVVEAPSPTFADFDTARFTHCVIDGRPIGALHPTKLDIVGRQSLGQATASGLSAGGGSFAVTRPAAVAYEGPSGACALPSEPVAKVVLSASRPTHEGVGWWRLTQ